MARTIDDIVQQMLGAQALTIARLQVENEALTDRVTKLEADTGAKAPQGGD